MKRPPDLDEVGYFEMRAKPIARVEVRRAPTPSVEVPCGLDEYAVRVCLQALERARR